MRTKSRPVIAPPPADFVEVKRRFIRQNRELAKNNSSQSLRIRSLEIEVGKLLADNLELKERSFRLESELVTARGRFGGQAVERVKEELRAKIAALSGLVDGLEDFVGKGQDEELVRPVEGGVKRAMEGQWRERQPLTEVMRETQMPTIVEDKLFPRRTLNAEEIQAIRLSDHGSTASPDLGPPPVARFDYGDPEKPAPSPSKAGEDEVLPGLSVNLETRRRRKDGQPRPEIRRHSVLPQSPEKKDTEPSTMLRTGAKRKLADREMERPMKPLAQADFTFTRIAKTKPILDPVDQAKGAAVAAAPQSAAEEAAGTPTRSARRVLGDKSVNHSPRKTTSVTTENKPAKPEENDMNRPGKPAFAPRSGSASTRAQSKHRRASSIPMPSPSNEKDDILPTVEFPPPTEQHSTAEPRPKTPAPPSLFSPARFEPSARLASDTRPGTPPPTDLSTLSTTTTTSDDNTAGRPSRRARSAVNYAEPSLVAKMRRPGRQMADAIGGLQDPRKAMSVTGERKVPVSEKRDEVFIKEEPTDDDDVYGCGGNAEGGWKALAPSCSDDSSPLGSKLADFDYTTRAVRGDEAAVKEEPAAVMSSAGPLTMSSLIAGSNGRRRRSPSQPQSQSKPSNSPAEPPPDTDTELNAATAKLAELDIYDFKASSSSPAGDHSREAAEKSATASQSQVSKQRVQRRHSSVLKDGGMTAKAKAGRQSVGLGVGPGAEAGGGRSERAANRRRSTLL